MLNPSLQLPGSWQWEGAGFPLRCLPSKVNMLGNTYTTVHMGLIFTQIELKLPGHLVQFEGSEFPSMPFPQ